MSKKSNVWQFFYKASDTVATCCLCQRNYSRKGRGTTCLRNHLKSRHPAEFMTLTEDIKYVVKREIGSSPSQHPTAKLEIKLHVSGFKLDCCYMYLGTSISKSRGEGKWFLGESP